MVVKIKKKKPITAPDEFIALPNRLVQYVRANLKQVFTMATICLILTSFLLLGRTWWQKKKQHAFLLYTEAESLLKNKNKDKALEILNQVTKTHTQAGKFACLQLADTYEQQHQWEKAIAMYQIYLEKSSDNYLFSPFVFHALSCDYHALGKYSETEKALETIVEKWPNHPLANWAYVNLGLLLEEENPSKALEMYNQATKKESPLNPPWIKFKIKTLQATKKSNE